MKEGGISARKAGLLWGLSMRKSLQVRLNRRVTFDRRIEIPSQAFFLFPAIPHSFVMFYFTMVGYIFGIDLQTTLQVQEKLISRLPVEISVQLRCYYLCPDTGPAVRILDNIGALKKYQFRDGNKSNKTLRS